MTQDQAGKVLRAASGKATGFVKMVKASKGPYGATHAATVSKDLADVTCRSCRAQLGIDDAEDANLRLEVLFVLSIMLGLRPGELRKLAWDHVDLNRGVVHATSGDRRAEPARTIRSSKRGSGEPLAKRGTTTTSSSVTKTATRTCPARSTGGSARRYRDCLPTCNGARDPWRGNSHGQRLQRRK
jgi:hypothetical protein